MKRIFYFLLCLTMMFSCQTDDNKDVDETLEVSTSLRQDYWNSFQRITPCEARNLGIFIWGCNDDRPPILDAIEDYNNLASSLHFRIFDHDDVGSGGGIGTYEEFISNGGVAIFIYCEELNNCGSGDATLPIEDVPNVVTFPSGGKIGVSLKIATSYANCPCEDEDYLIDCGIDPSTYEIDHYCLIKRAVLHELGHTLGVAHNGQFNMQGNPTNVSGTPDTQYDDGSIFNEGTLVLINCDWCDGPCEFNENDITALEFLYPAADDGDKCYCVCDAVDTHDDEPYTEYVEIECCDERSCAEILNGGDWGEYNGSEWGEYIPNPEDDCIKVTNPCIGTPPQVTLTGPQEICEEEGYVTICVSGYSGPTSWTISGPNLSDTEVSNHNCLSYDVEPGTYIFSTRICEGDCCVNLTHTVVVTPGPCEEECYCVCEEGDGEGGYTTVELPIDCSEDCAEQYPKGDEYFDCRKMVR